MSEEQNALLPPSGVTDQELSKVVEEQKNEIEILKNALREILDYNDAVSSLYL